MFFFSCTIYICLILLGKHEESVISNSYTKTNDSVVSSWTVNLILIDRNLFEDGNKKQFRLILGLWQFSYSSAHMNCWNSSAQLERAVPTVRSS